jgi:hypothetical protein
MSKQLKLRRGTTAQHSTFTGASGEVTVDTTKKALVVHDGATAGGVPMATEASVTTGLAGKQPLASELTAIAAAGNAMFKNRIINGAMMIDQRNAGASVTTQIGYLVDRFFTYQSQAGKFSFQQNQGSVTPPAGFKNYAGFTSSSAYSVVSGDVFDFGQVIEGLNVADLGWGTSDAQAVTLSFWVRSSLTGTFGGVIMNSAQNTTYPFSYTIPSANTWTKIVLNISGPTTGTWLTTNGNGMQISFSLGAGSTYLGTANTWGTANVRGVTGQVNVVGTSGATWYMTGMQFEKGSTATAFDYRPYGTELALCQRYYERLPSGGYPSVGVRTTDWYGYVQWQTEKRASATVTLNGTINIVGSVGDINTQTPTGIDQATTKTVRIYKTGGTFTTQAGTFYVPNYIEISSEL